MAGRKSDFTLTKLDDLFSTQEQRDEEKLSKIRDIPLTEIDDFPDHPFKVRDDEDMAQLIESIKERGVITPATVRQKEDGGKCIFMLRGVRPFLSDKYDLTRHPNYRYTADADPKNVFDMERYMKKQRAVVKPTDTFDVYEIDATT